MSRKRTRARNRRALQQRLVAEFQKARSKPEAFASLLRRIAESDVRLWAVAQAAGRNRPLDDDETAQVAQAVAPHLAAATPGCVRRRHEWAELDRPAACIRSQFQSPAI